MTPEHLPPQRFRQLLGAALPDGIVREDVVSNLDADYAARVERLGRRNADGWYRRQAVGLIVRVLWLRAAKGKATSSLVMDTKFAWRAFRHAPGPYLVAVVTIALGVGVNAAMFSVVHGVILERLPYPGVERLVKVWPEKRWSADLLRDVRESTESFERIAAGLGGTLTLLGEGEPEFVSFTSVTAGYFELFGGYPLVGRVFVPEDESGGLEPAVILAWDFWQSRFGADPDVVGRTLELSGYGVERRTVVGIMPRDFEGVPQGDAGWIPWITNPDAPGYRGTYGGGAVARLAPEVSERQAIGELRSLIPSLRDVHSTQFRESRYSPVDVVPLKESIVRDVRTQLLVLLGAVGLVLLIACSNVATLLLARSTARRREVGLRLALGADRFRVLRQMVTESLLLGLVGGAVGLVAAVSVMPFLRTELAEYLPRAEHIGLDVEVALYAAALSLLASLISGVVPGARAARHDPSSVLNEHGRGSGVGRRRARINDFLVMAEVAMSLVLIAGAGLMLKSLQRLSRVDVGFRAEGVLSVAFGVPSGRYDEEEAREALFLDMLDRVRSVPGVQGVAVVNGSPLQGAWSGIPYMVRGQEVPAGQSIVAGFRAVSPEYFAMLGIPLLDGRLLSEQDRREGELVVVTNEAFVRRHWPGESALDRIVLDSAGEELARVVGVVGDTLFGGLEQDPVPALYFAAGQIGWTVYNLLVRAHGEPIRLLGPVSEAVHAAEPNIPIREPRALEDIVREAAGDTRFYARLLGLFAGLALLLGLVGVYGVTAYAVGERTREIGVRVALGATRGSLLVETLARGMTPVATGIGVGLVGALGTTRLLGGLLYGVDATDPWVFAGVVALLASSAVAAIVVPARRATRVDPGIVLRAE